MKQIKLLLLCSLSTAILPPTHGADIRYVRSGDWFRVEAIDGGGWQAPGIPGETDNARANWGGNTIFLAGVAPNVLNVQLGVDESGTLEINSGGLLTATRDVLAGNNNSNATGTLTVNDGGTLEVGRILWAAQSGSMGVINVNSGGTVNVASHLWLGVTGTAVINISGTLKQTGGILGLGTSDAVSPTGGKATVNVNDGGTLALNNIHAQGTSIQSLSALNVNGTGQITLPGDFVNVIGGYIDNSRILGNGIAGRAALIVDLTTNPGFTTVTAAPVGPREEFRISSFGFDPGTGQYSLTWDSIGSDFFKVMYGTDLINWDGVLETRLPAATGQNSTSYSFNQSNLEGLEFGQKLFFRVERVP